MAGGGGVAAYIRTDKRPSQDWQTMSILTKRFTAFDWTPESSRFLLFWTSEEAPCIFSSHLIVNLVVYLCAKALNPRINETRSGGNLFQPVPQVQSQLQTSRFSIPLIFLLSNVVSMFPRASGTIMDNNLHVSSHSYASLSRAPVKYFLALMDPLDYPLYDAYSNHVTASESFSITSGYGRNLQNLQNPLGCWFRALGVCKYYMISLFVKKLLLNACLMPVLHPTLCRFLHSWIPKTGF